MFKSVLVVCVGNICRSPMGEVLLQQALPDLRISSAGISALVGKPADATTEAIAQQHGVSLQGHRARQFTPTIGGAHDLILVMESGHKRVIDSQAPHLGARTMLFSYWTTGQGIVDPYMKPDKAHEAAFIAIRTAAFAWVKRLQV